MSKKGIIIPHDSITCFGLTASEKIQAGREYVEKTRDSYTAAAQTHRSQVIIPGEKIEGNRHRKPASINAINSVESCIVRAATFCNNGIPGMHPASRASSFRFQQIGRQIDVGKVLAYGAKVPGAPTGTSGLSRGKSRVEEATEGFPSFANRWWMRNAKNGARYEIEPAFTKFFGSFASFPASPASIAILSAFISAVSTFFLS
mmetsp:Transcript_12256/g.25892  ORF Transcript_12256/g.25892 Transcript_12256/m.25892 type:complete len:203 (+) Transcript_12256:2584-3192(+)